MTCPEEPTPIYDDAVAELLADYPPAGPIRPDDEPPLIEDVALPTLGDGNGEESPSPEEDR